MITPDLLEEMLANGHWRREPFLIKGGAHRFFDPPLTPDRFNQLCQEMGVLRPDLLFRAGKNTVFAQNLDLVGEEFRAVSDRFKRHATGADVWFDAVMAAEGMGIGSHYDIADTFLLQQSGCKVWLLHEPDFISTEEQRARFLNETAVDAMYMPDDAREFIVEAGDLLYLPLLWVHWGVSRGDSLSISLALTSRCALQSLFPALTRVALENRRELIGASETGMEGATDRLLNRLIALLRGSDLRDALYHELWQALYGNEKRQTSAVEAPDRELAEAFSKLGRALRKFRTWWSPVPVIWGDASRSDNPYVEAARKHFVALFSAFDALDPGGANGPDDEQDRRLEHAFGLAVSPPTPPPIDLTSFRAERPDLGALLEDLDWTRDQPVAMVKLKASVDPLLVDRFVLICQKCFERLPSKLRRRWLDLLIAISRTPAERLREIAGRPEMTLWIWRAAAAIQHGYLPRIIAIAEWAPHLLAPYMDEVTPGAEERLPGQTMEPGHGQRGLCLFSLNANGGFRRAGAGANGAQPDSDYSIIASRWLSAFFPQGAFSGGIVPETAPSQRAAGDLPGLLETAVSYLGENQSLAQMNVRLLAVRRPGTAPQESLSTLRGIVFIPASASAMDIAQSLVRECARIAAYDLLERFAVFKTRREVGYYFPFLNLSLPMFSLFHEWFARFNEFQWRMESDFVESPDWRRKRISWLASRRELLLQQSELTDEGRMLIGSTFFQSPEKP